MTRIFLFFLAVLTAGPALSQDSLVLVSELTYANNLEKRAFQNYLTGGQVDHFGFFCANGSLLTEKQVDAARLRFYQYLESLKARLAGKKNDKKAKIVYEGIHQEFLRKYEEKNHFEEIFHTGYYNCVSASALYGLAFDYLGIPYAIKEKPSHVYVMAFPEAERIMVETTSPTGGYFEFNPAFKQAFLKNLREDKLISPDEFNSQDIDGLFDQYYFGKQENIDAIQLIAIQYMNDALVKMEEGKGEAALQLMEKAYMLYPGKRSAYLLMLSASQAFDDHKVRDDKQAILLGKLARYKDQGIESDQIIGEYSQALTELQNDVTKKAQLTSYHETLMKTLRNESLRKEITYLYEYETGRVLYTQMRYKEALPWIENALKAKPTNLEAINAFTSCLSHTLNEKDFEGAAAKLEKYKAEYPELGNNNHFMTMTATVYLLQFAYSYDMEEIANGNKFMAQFEAIMNQHKDLNINDYILGKAYSTVAVYFFRKGQNAKAKAIIAKGLTYSPNNSELLMRQKMIR